MSVRTRFAPSPTGYLHVGGARTALFAWLYAKQRGGQFVLRVEDTDRERSTDASVQAILDGMAWLGLDADEGPVFQTGRYDRYRDVVAQLLESGHAYVCDCSPERLDRVRSEQMARGEKPRYDGHCRDRALAPGAGVVRFRNPDEGSVTWDDAVYGAITVANAELDDFVILRSDGNPTYNFCVVVDDSDMAISHVIRGDDHINNTPRQINLYRALEASLPVFGHLPMILGADGKRLSKRHGAVSVLAYRDAGYLPDALLNYLARLGWAHGDQEVFSRDEMTELFTLDAVNRKGATFDPVKLDWLNAHYLKALPGETLAARLAERAEQAGLDLSAGPPVASVAALLVDRVSTLDALLDQCRYFYADFDAFDPVAAKKHLRPVAKAVLQSVQDGLVALDDWQPEAIQARLNRTAESLEVGFGKVGQPLRVAVTGQGASPSLDNTLALIGKSRTLARLERALVFIEAREAASGD
ncbi:MAG: glutamate--tRNA ligase [Pseudomonadota bacterium]